MKVQITADSTIDLSQPLLDKYDIKTIGLSINLGDEEFIDGENITTQEIFDYIKTKNALPKTGAVSVERYKEFFSKFSNDDTAIIHFTISSEMSSCYNFAVSASKDFKNVYVIDSRYLSTGIAQLAIFARNLANKDVPAKEIAEKVQEMANNNKVQCSFILDNLKLLHKGGRCSAVQRFGANLLHIKVCIGVHDGKMGVDRKYKGKFENAIFEYIEDCLKLYPNYDTHCCFVTYTTASGEVLDKINTYLKNNTNFENIYLTTAGGTIASHCGEETIGILYLLK